MKEKAFVILLLVAILSIAGIAAVNMSKEKKDPNLYMDLNETESQTEQYAAETETTKEPVQVAMDDPKHVGDAVLAEGETPSIMDMSNLMDATDEPITENTTDMAEVPTQENAEPVGGPAISLSFNESSTLKWPIQGNVIMDFSMDSTVFYATLQQYKYNPAILIQGEVNTPVLAAADGIVTEISSNEEIGDYVVMALGDEYELLYGQLKALEVSMGDNVKAGDIIGYVSEPTKYFIVEGSNLYLKLLKGETPIDPLDYIR